MSMSDVRPTLGLPLAIAQGGLRRFEPAEEARLRAVVERYFDLIWRSLRRFGVAEAAADDAVQHVLLTFAERLDAVEPGSERAFLLSTAVRVAANARRRDERGKEVAVETLEQLGAGEFTPESLLEAKQRRLTLDEVLGTLPLDQRAVFVLFELEGFTLPEIAESLDIPLGTATSRLRRARGRFESCVLARNPSEGVEP
jgi:RNA polymerase sigma-70 factor, ECF subfamily